MRLQSGSYLHAVTCTQLIAVQVTVRLAIHFLNEQNVAALAATEVRQHKFCECIS